MNVQVFSRLRPKAGTKTGMVWDIADQLTQEKGRKATRHEVVAKCMELGGNAATASTQYNEWQKSYQSSTKDDFESSLHSTEKLVLQVGSDGRVVIPQELRRLMLIGDDGKVTARVVDGELRMIAPAMAVRRLQDLVKRQDIGSGSIVDELIADRRREAEKE